MLISGALCLKTNPASAQGCARTSHHHLSRHQLLANQASTPTLIHIDFDTSAKQGFAHALLQRPLLIPTIATSHDRNMAPSRAFGFSSSSASSRHTNKARPASDDELSDADASYHRVKNSTAVPSKSSSGHKSSPPRPPVVQNVRSKTMTRSGLSRRAPLDAAMTPQTPREALFCPMS